MNMKVMDRDIFFMKRALQLAAKARGRTSPNPMVGAVIVKNGRVIAEDYHKKPGELHAEALAILKAQNSGLKTQNSILYVTLEPCCHTDKRTPPCTKAIIDAGIKKVYVAMKDPNHRVSGKGIEELKSHGIEVISGLLEGNAKTLNEVYIKYITTKMPFVILKTAMTLDGKIATPDRQSKWITGEKARKIVHQMRSSVDAVMTAIGTVKADNPELTARIKGGRSPKRIVIDPNLETPLDYKVFNVPPETIIVTGSQRSEEKKKALIDKGVKIIEYEGGKVNLKWLMRELGNIGITSLMIEAGSSFNASALNDRIVDKVVFFIAPKIIGGKDSITPVGGDTFQKLQDAYKIRDLKIRRAGEDLMIEGYLHYPES
jgi:diaminohydroxyphosphoribosylaminopyrimidine deaminase/5-amino-6-(5-phosphoribosylamino)uracil reductase